MPTMTKSSLYHKFQYHPIDAPEHREKAAQIYAESWKLVELILDLVPDSSCRDHSVMAVKEATIFAVEALRECETKI
jgi:hypothetical protein